MNGDDSVEQWKQIVVDGVAYHYEISNCGRVRNSNTGREVKPHNNGRGYLKVTLKRKCLLIHRLVAIMFIPNPNNLPQVNHKDKNRLNNNVDNLEWCTAEYNLQYSHKGKTVSEETRRKISESKTGTKYQKRVALGETEIGEKV